MNTRIILNIEQSLVEKTIKIASAKGKSLSDFIEAYLKVIATEEDATETDLSPIVKSLKGSFKAPDHFDYKRELSERLAQKYM